MTKYTKFIVSLSSTMSPIPTLRHFLFEKIKNIFSSNYDISKINDNLFMPSYFGQFDIDYTLSTILTLSKMLKTKPEVIRQLVIDNIVLNDWTIKYEKGNLCFNIQNNYLKNNIQNITCVPKTTNPKKILVDFSSPNIAKDMHVGHLRSTIIGDSMCRLFEKQGHDVLRINHIGDFGLQFGMLIQLLFENYPDFSKVNIGDLQIFYAESKKRFDQDPEFKKQAYQKVVDLQQGKEDVVNAWNLIKEVSRKAYQQIYDRLNIKLTEVGESFYQNMIPNLIEELKEKKLLESEDGRHIIKIKGIKEPLTVIKSDGGYTYDTTDLAAIRYRLLDLKVDELYYVVDLGQSNHFKQIFAVAKLAGWLTNQKVKHVGFGFVLGEQGKKLRSRDGGTVKLIDLLNESFEKTKLITDKRKYDEEQKDIITATIATGVIKYADLSTTRTKDYTISFDKMLALKGNTAPYLMYAYVRICSILRKASDSVVHDASTFEIVEPSEADLCKYLLRYPEIINKLNNDMMFHSLASYLYELSEFFHKFFKNCQCLEYNKEKTEIIKTNTNRLFLCELTKKIMRECFDILGLKVIDQM